MADPNENARRPRGNLSRRRLLQGTAGTLGAALASAGIYKVIDTIADPPDRLAIADSPPSQEQYILQDVRMVMDNGSGMKSSNGTISVLVPPAQSHHYRDIECPGECESLAGGAAPPGVRPPGPGTAISAHSQQEWASRSPGDSPTSSHYIPSLGENF